MSGRYQAARHNVALLQDLVKRDPESYREEFLQQFTHYNQILKVIEVQPEPNKMDLDPLVESVNFVSQVCHLYPTESVEFTAGIVDLLRTKATALHPDVRLSLCKAVVLMRNRGVADQLEVMQLFFELIKCEDKPLRKFVYGSIVSQVKRVSVPKSSNARRKDPLKKTGVNRAQLQSALQAFTFAKLRDGRSIVSRMALLVLIDAFRKGFWRDAKTANAIAECCFHKVAKIQMTALKFFLGSTREEGNESDQDDLESDTDKGQNSHTLKEVMTAYRVGKKTKKKKRETEKAKKLLGKEKKTKRDAVSGECNLVAIYMLFDAQSFAERLCAQLESRSKTQRFQLRLLQIALTSRIIGVHKLLLLHYYSYLYRYLQPKQTEVTRILLYAAQAAHSSVPPDTIEQLIRVIAQNFITDRNSTEAITVGINAVREVLTNCPAAATEELLGDLVEYKKYKNKNVAMAAKGLMHLFRTVNPKLLHRKDRGRPTDATKNLAPISYGAAVGTTFVPGAEVLATEEKGSDDDEEEEEEVDDESDDEDDWADVSSDGNAEDSDEEEDQQQDSVNVVTKNREDVDERAVAEVVSNTRIITQTEHKRLQAERLKRQLRPASGRKRKHQEEMTNDERLLREELKEKLIRQGSSGDGLCRLADIERLHKKPRRETKEERLAGVMEGREGREKFGRPKPKGAHVGRTNRNLAKTKPFSMVAHKQRGKKRQRSFREQQRCMRNYVLRQQGKGNKVR